VAVIELDLDAPPAPSSTRPPVHLLRPLGLALAVVLLLALGGAAPITPNLWRGLGVIPLTTEDYRYELHGDHLYTVDSPVDARRDVTAWSLDPIRKDWTFATQVDGADDVDVIHSRINIAPVDGVLLLHGDTFATSILDPGTGAVLWTTPGWPYPLGAGRGLIQESHFRPATEYDLKSGDAGELYWSSDGQPHTEPPLRTTLHGVDIRTGERSWKAEAPGAVFTAPTEDGSGVLVVAADKLTVLDQHTGKVLRERTMPRLESDDDVAWVDMSGDLLLLRRSPADEWGTVTAYAMDTLEQRWEIPDPPGQGYGGSCYGLPCQKEEAARAPDRSARLADRGQPPAQQARRRGAGDAAHVQPPDAGARPGHRRGPGGPELVGRGLGHQRRRSAAGGEPDRAGPRVDRVRRPPAQRHPGSAARPRRRDRHRVLLQRPVRRLPRAGWYRGVGVPSVIVPARAE
jgi:hypothetical protein